MDEIKLIEEFSLDTKPNSEMGGYLIISSGGAHNS